MQKGLFGASIAFIISACAHGPQLKTELDQSTGVRTTSSRPIGLDPQVRNSEVYERPMWDEGSLQIQVVRLDNPDASKVYEIKITADGQSPRLKILKENSLVFQLKGEKLKYSPSRQDTNNQEPLTEYFPSFRVESATYSNIAEGDLQKIANADDIMIKIFGESRQYEHRLNKEVQEVILSLLRPSQP